MAYARLVMERARQLYAEGLNYEAISRELAKKGSGFGKVISPQTISRWKVGGYPKNGREAQDWDKFRSELEESVAQQVKDRLSKHRRDLAETHFKDLEQLRIQVTRAQYEEDADGNLTPRKLSPMDCHLLAAAFQKVQTGQRLIFGQAGYNVALGPADPTGDVEEVGELDPARVRRRIKQLIAKHGPALEQLDHEEEGTHDHDDQEGKNGSQRR